MTLDQKLTVCIGCDGGAELADALGDAAQPVPCLNVCDRPATVALRAPGKWAYLFGGVRAEMAQEVFRLTSLYDEASDGDITDARSLPRLRHCLIGRIPG